MAINIAAAYNTGAKVDQMVKMSKHVNPRIPDQTVSLLKSPLRSITTVIRIPAASLKKKPGIESQLRHFLLIDTLECERIGFNFFRRSL
jgi:hypothetical protein